MNHKMNLITNLLEYQNIRDLENDDWLPNDEEGCIPYDMERIKDIQNYMKKHNIVFDERDPIDFTLKAIYDVIMSGYEDYEIYSDEDWDLKTMEEASYYFGGNESAALMYSEFAKEFKPIFSDDKLNNKLENEMKAVLKRLGSAKG